MRPSTRRHPILPRPTTPALVLALAATVAVGCTSDGAGPAAVQAPPTGAPQVEEPSDRLTVTAEVAERNVLAADLSVTSPVPAVVQVTARSGAHVVETPRTAVAADHHDVALVGLRADRTYDVEVRAYDESGALVDTATTAVTSGALPGFVADFERVTADPDAMQDGFTVVEVVPSDGEAGHVLAIDADGEVVWYYRNSASVSAVSQTTRGTFLGLVYPYTYLEFDTTGDTLARWEFGPATAAVPDGADVDQADLAFGFVDDPPTTWIDVEGIDVRSPHHDISELPNGNLLGLAMTSHEVSAEFRRATCPTDDRVWEATSDVIVEFERDGTVVRTWDVWDVVDIEEHPGRQLCVDQGLFASPSDRDWSHGNAAVYDATRDVVIVSLRHTDQVIAFEHADGEGVQTDVRWVLGPTGSLIIDGEPQYHQHAPEVHDDGTILIYDNGNDRPLAEGDRPYSRAVEYVVDDSVEDATWRAVQEWEHRVDDVDGTPLYAPFLGDADRLSNGNVLITHGGIGEPGELEQRARIIEVVADRPTGGRIVMDLRFGTDARGLNSYRADRIDSFYVGEQWEASLAE